MKTMKTTDINAYFKERCRVFVCYLTILKLIFPKFPLLLKALDVDNYSFTSNGPICFFFSVKT